MIEIIINGRRCIYFYKTKPSIYIYFMRTFLKTICQSIKHWYIPGIIGLVFVVFGLYLFSLPLATYLTLVMLFSLSFLFSGILEIFFSLQNRRYLEEWGWYLTGGLFSVLIGLILVAYPALSATLLPLVLGTAILVRSIQGLGFSFDLKSYGLKQWWHLGVLSIMGIVLSILVILNPLATGISLAMLLAFSFVVAGISAIVLSIQLKKLHSLPKRLSKELKEKIEDLREEYYEYIHKA